ncbi:ribonuclease [Parafrankia colletiae]|uniref:Ribonuclease E n=1 Tax=Parafrankia colletiae TaxID=573497 RepID=A0A1S1QTU7_9ACTN|nr:ribonuclease [Parafrankia colletiae]
MPDEDQTTEEQQTAPETSAVRSPRRRRAAGRPAGPPPGASGPPPDPAETEAGPQSGAEKAPSPAPVTASTGTPPSTDAPAAPGADGADPATDSASTPTRPARRTAARPRRVSRAVSAAGPEPAAAPAPSTPDAPPAADAAPPADASPIGETSPAAVVAPEKPAAPRRRATRSAANAAPARAAAPASAGDNGDGGATAAPADPVTAAEVSAAPADTTEQNEAAPAATRPRRTRARRSATKAEPVESSAPTAPAAAGPQVDGPSADPMPADQAGKSPAAETSVAAEGSAPTGAPARSATAATAVADEPAVADEIAVADETPAASVAKVGTASGDATVAAGEVSATSGAAPAVDEQSERPARRRTRAFTPTWTSGTEAGAAAPATRPTARRPVAMIMFQQPEPAAPEPWGPRRHEPAPDSAVDEQVADAAVDDLQDSAADENAEFDADDAGQEAADAGAFGADADLDADSDDTGAGGTRRRRRGRRGRGRARGEDETTDLTDDDGEAEEPIREPREPEAVAEEHEAAEARPARRRSRRVEVREVFDEPDEDDGDADLEPGAEHDQESDEDGADGADLDDGAEDSADDGTDDDRAGGSRRRRRRRRRSGTGESVPTSDDPPNTVVHVRETRRDDDLVRGVSGSTRLEAKRQRRREGRDSGRRRAPIVTEAEFLARRESVERRMIVKNNGDRTQIAVLEDGVLVEHFVTRASSASYAGNVYLGRVQNVLASMEAAFVDIGKGRNAVLYAGEVNYDASGLDGRPRKIEQVLKSGQSVLVQVSKDPIGHKGARLTSQVSLPGRYLVYVPDGQNAGISRKLPDTERARLKSILKKITPENGGVIVRTAAEGASEAELERDVERLVAQWEDIQHKAQKASAPSLLYGEPDLVVRVIRDIFNEDFTELVVQGAGEAATVEGYVDTVAPDLRDRVRRYVGTGDVFAEYRVDEQLAKALDRKVWLPSGGSLVIDRTEAMTVIDVNTGKFTGKGGNLEETVTKNNLEAAEEIVRQLRLRDIGGIIVIDFIDMVLESNRELVLRRLTECLGRDRTRHQVAEVTSLGLVQMTRKRVGQGLLEAYSEPCAHCNGRGVTIHLDGAHASAPPPPAPPAQQAGPTGRRARQAAKSAGPSLAAAASVPEVAEEGDVQAASPDGESAAGEDGAAGTSGGVTPGAGGEAVAAISGVRGVRGIEAARQAGSLSDPVATAARELVAAGQSAALPASDSTENAVFANTDDPDSVLHAGTNGAGPAAVTEKPARTRRRRASRPVSKPAETLQPSDVAGS